MFATSTEQRFTVSLDNNHVILAWNNPHTRVIFPEGHRYQLRGRPLATQVKCEDGVSSLAVLTETVEGDLLGHVFVAGYDGDGDGTFLGQSLNVHPQERTESLCIDFNIAASQLEVGDIETGVFRSLGSVVCKNE